MHTGGFHLGIALLICLAACGGSGGETAADDGGTALADTTAEDATRSEVAAGTWWRPAVGASGHIQLQGDIDTSHDVDLYDLDLFDPPDSVFAAIHARGARLVCYFSAGSREDWRMDAGEFPAAAIGKAMAGWPGEMWLDIRSAAVRSVLERRLDHAVLRGCDGVDPDNINAWQNDSGFPLTKADTRDFLGWLAAESHARGLAVGLKNGNELALEVEPDFEWELNEECLAFDECDLLTPFVDAGKPVFHIEYVDREADGPALQASVCASPKRRGFSTLIKTWELTDWGLSCPAGR